jgi:collagenase-like PrtC family protease
LKKLNKNSENSVGSCAPFCGERNMMKQRKIELLAPAKNLECGIEAVNHGADAVYIGAPKFGARAAAVNSLEDIAALVAYAHLYNVRIYVTVNTILKEEELAETEKMIWELYRIGVDALIVQDMGITRLNLPPIPLHGSTQMDNRTPEKVRFLADAGFRQVVLARELSLQEIRRIHEACPETPLEVFVHGALCVSYSGQCYVSQACFGRSANRGECAQFCRLPFSLVDADGKTIVRDKHLLSLKDLNQSEVLEDLLDAGASSLKIEGRLKDVSYVKNVTAAYRSKLDAIFARRKEYVRASSGTCRFDFTPRLDKSFSRGFTHYFLQGRDREISSFDTPKSLGEEMGTMKEQRGNYLTVAGVKPFHNGDGVCFLDEQGRLQGFRINRVDGNKLYPAGDVPRIKPRTRLFRNFDQEFERILARKSAERKIGVGWELTDTPSGFALTAADEDGNRITLSFPYPKELARTPQPENLRTQLGKLGNTPFEVMPLGGTDSPSATTAPAIAINLSQNWFIPASVIADWRRQAIDKLIAARRITYRRELHVWKPTRHRFPATSLTYLGNVMNTAARSFYQAHGVASVEPAYEKQAVPEAVLMFCKHCLRYSMGWCPTYQKGHSPYREPYYLVGTDGKRFRLTFDCKNCQMKVSS